ncbi:hypothetical protein BKA63DRAFT_584924 [Paraphoma chrysanthemicola]|nr:hypothetical protein BKA63DRAFT_584924 [Paraphoma chrysanthemicola]
MSGSAPNRSNRAPSGNYPLSDYNASPRHGRIRSRTIESPGSPQGVQRAYPAGPTSPPQGYRPISTVIYDPNQPPNDLQRFIGLSMEPFLRWAFTIVDERGRVHPNHNYLPDIDNAPLTATRASCTNSFSAFPNRDLGHPAMEHIRQNRSMVELLLYRHYQNHGGLVLPPTAPANEAMRRYGNGVELMPNSAEWPRLKFRFGRKEKKGSEAQKGRSKNNSGGVEGKPFWGAPGDGRPRGPPGGAAGGGVAI